jgi:hypothetical protein
MKTIRFDDIQVDPGVFATPRVVLGDIEELARHILVEGLLEPLVVWRQAEQHYLVDGWRRFAALEWIREQHPDVFTRRLTKVVVEETAGDEYEVLLQVTRRNLLAGTYSLADLANAVLMLFPAYWLNILASELGVEERLVEAALRLKLSASDDDFLEFARVSTSITDLPGLLGRMADVAVEEIQRFIREHHARRDDRYRAGRERGADRQATRKHTRPKIAELRQERDQAVEELRVFRVDYVRTAKPTTLTGLPDDGERAYEVIYFRGEEARLTARIEALDWVLGEEPEIG